MKKRQILFILLLSLITLIGLFYWFQIRPTQIKHDCSWVKKHSDSIPAKQGLTVEQLRAKGLIKNCSSDSNEKLDINAFLDNKQLFGTRRKEILCQYDNSEIIKNNKSQKYIPSKDWFVKASKEEYQFCLHDKGL